MLGNLIGGFITILVGVSLLPTIANEIKSGQYPSNETNITGASATIINLVPLFFALGVMSAGVAVTAQGLRAAGMLI